MINLVLGSVKAQQKKISNRLLADQVSLIKHIVKKVVDSPGTSNRIVATFMRDPVVIVKTSSFVILEQRKYTDKGTKVEDRCQKVWKLN